MTGGSSSSDSMWFGVALGILAGLILLYAFLVEGRRWIIKRQRTRKEAAARKEAAIRELEMQADLFVKSHLETPSTAANSERDMTGMDMSEDDQDEISDDVNWMQNRSINK